jgi:hypothetical protein
MSVEHAVAKLLCCCCSAEDLGRKSFQLLTNTSKHRAMLQVMAGYSMQLLATLPPFTLHSKSSSMADTSTVC